MISIIIASVNPAFLSKIKANIAEKIGIPYELLIFENKSKKGLCELYNLGGIQAKYEILCYMHEDVEIETDHWGSIVIEYFKRTDLGVLGLAGSTYKSVTPSGWGADDQQKSVNFRNFIQHFKRLDQQPLHEYYNPEKLSEVEVTTLDGMWFCTTKTIVSKFPFDEHRLKGFHCYDMDFCLNVGLKFRLMVTYKILLTHFSEGGYNKDWVEDTLTLHSKWNNTLPRSISNIASPQKKVIEFRNLRSFIKTMVALDYPQNRILEVVDKYKLELSWYLRLKLQLYLYKAVGKRKN
jgi:hypothetical protein